MSHKAVLLLQQTSWWTSYRKSGVVNLRPAGQMRPARTF